jgi:hypothetical protein
VSFSLLRTNTNVKWQKLINKNQNKNIQKE